MASTVLPNGIIIPEKYSRDWYNDLYHNWQELDNLLGGGTPKDGTLTIQKNGDTVGTFSANQATDETINITVPDVNNGTLTIQQNSTTVDTFTANSSSDKTVNISVPTKTSDLNNDSGFITGVSWNDVADKPSFATVATSGSYNDLSNKPTIPTVNNGTLTIQQNGTNVQTFTANASTNKTANIQCVDLSTVQTIGGQKTFSSSPRVTKAFPDIALNISDCDVTELPTESKSASLYFRDKNNKNLAYLVAQQKIDGKKRLCLRTHRTDNINNYYSVNFDSDGNFYPEQNNAIDIGTSALKWKSIYTNTINGINPGALSLPGTSVNVDTTNWVLDGSNANIFTPVSDGWLGIQATDTVYDQMHYVFVGRTGGGNTYYQQNIMSPINALWDGEYHGCVFIPVIKGLSYHIRCICNLVVATFYPCQGNV